MGRMVEWANGKVRNSPAPEIDPLALVEVLGWGLRVMFSGPFVLFSFPEQRTLIPVDVAEWVFPWFAVVIRGFSVWVWVTLTLLGLPVQRTLTLGGPSLVSIWPETSWSTFSVSVSICACIKICDCTQWCPGCYQSSRQVIVGEVLLAVGSPPHGQGETEVAFSWLGFCFGSLIPSGVVGVAFWHSWTPGNVLDNIQYSL